MPGRSVWEAPMTQPGCSLPLPLFSCNLRRRPPPARRQQDFLHSKNHASVLLFSCSPPLPPTHRRAGYVRHFRELERLVRARFPDAPLTFAGEGTAGATGWLEVSVNGRLVFSKKGGGACGGLCGMGGACSGQPAQPGSPCRGCRTWGFSTRPAHTHTPI
jgi:selT/selW/selH-like putative selenoprotein